MMELEPKALTFRDVFLNQAYTSSVCITNPLTAPVEFTLRPSSPRYTVTPNRVNLSGGQSIVVTVRLFLSHYPNFRQGLRGQDDTIHIKSAYFEQKLDVAFFLHSRDSTTLASRSRSSSPMRPGMAAAVAGDSLAELQRQVHAKDAKIAQLETIIGQLESKYPSVQEIVRNRIEQERVIFEEKSEKRKDEEIGYLQGQLAESSSTIALLRLQKTAESSASRNVEAENSEAVSNLRDMVGKLEKSLAESASRIKGEETAHVECQKRLDKAIRELDQAREVNRQEERVAATSPQHDQHHQELRGLRERTLDQAEQIDVLVTEISKLRSEAQSTGALSLAQDEISRLQIESKQLKGRLDSLKQENSSLKTTVEHLNSALAVSAAAAAATRTESPVGGGESDAGAAFRSPPRPSRAGHVSWGGPAAEGQFEPSVGALGTPLPSRFHARTADDLSQILQERTAQVRLYQERAEKVENENDELRGRLSEARDIENDLRQRLRDGDVRSAELETELKVILDRVERHRRDKEELELKLEDRESQLRSAVEKSQAGEIKNRERDAHVWWSYVWHEMKRQNSENIMNEGQSNKFEGSPAEDAMVKLSTLKANMSAQAIELVSLRQELLGRKLSSKSEVAALKEQLDLSHRETVRLNALIRTHRGDKETRLAEMATTIRSLSARSEIHTQLAAARQELEAEKITNHHLRADVESHRSILESEHSKCSFLRKENNLLQGQIDASSIMRAVTGVPGVDPAVLIELMGGKIISLQAEQTKFKSTLVQAQTQINNLQRAAFSLEKSRQTNAPVSLPQQAQDVATRSAFAATSMPAPLAPQNSPLSANQSATFESDTSFADSYSQPTIGAFSIAIDGECTPKKVLDCLDVATLAHQVRFQETYIATLKVELSKLCESALQAENARLGDRDHYEDSYRIDAESSAQKLELLQIALNEAKTEISAMRQENEALQKALCNAQIDSITNIAGDRQSTNYPAEWEAHLGDSINSTFVVDSDDIREEFEKTKLLLRERTTQLKIVMETLDALHVAGIKEKGNEENVFRENSQGHGDLALLASTPLPSVEGSWGVQSLVKRVVELTTELTSQCATASLEERRANQLDEEMKRSHRELNKQRSLVRNGEEMNAKMNAQIVILSERLKESEKLRTEQSSNYRREFDDLLSALREAETKLSTTQVTINELRQQASLSEKDGFQEWIDHILTDGSVPSSPLESSLVVADEGSVRTMVDTLLREWRDHVASYPQRSPKPGASISKTEQRFLQRVSDLVMESHRKHSEATISMRRSELKAEIAENSSRVVKEKLKTTLLHLHRYRKRSLALENIVRCDSRFDISQSERVKALIRKALLEERRKYSECFSTMLIERRDHKLNEIKKAFDAKKMLAQQHRIAELECKGSATLRGREEASYALESMVKVSEESMHRWFKTELPRLISGLPLTEDTMGFSYTSSSSDGDLIAGLGFSKDSQQAAASLGLDRTFALAQALCCSKASAAVQDVKLQGALEKNSLLKSRVIELEGVLSRWRSDIDSVEELSASLQIGHSVSIGDSSQDRREVVLTSSETESNLLDRIQQLTARVLEVEEENIVAAGRAEHALERNDELKGLLDLLMKEEEVLKHKAAKQMSKLRSDFEQHHAAELRNIRELYEAEKKDLTDELEKVLGAVDFARATVEAVPSAKPSPSASAPNVAAVPPLNDSEDSDSLEDRGQRRNISHQHDGQFQASAMLSVVDATDEVGNRIRSLLSQMSSSSRRLDSIRPPITDTLVPDGTELDKRDAMELQREIDSLQSALETERVRSREARAEVFELEQLLNAQRAAFSDRVHGMIDTGSVQHHESPSARSASNSIASPGDHSHHFHDTGSAGGMLDMDANLWPTLGSLLDELSTSLQHLPVRYKNMANDSYLRTSLALVARIKRVLAQGSEGFNISTPAMEHSSPQDHSSPSIHPGTPTLQTLLDQVQLLENKLSTERNPEKNIILLRDLRLRVSELEASMSNNFERQKESWDLERVALNQALQDSTATVEGLRRSQEEAMAGIKARYENALLQTQEALEQQTAAATDHINRLDDLQRNSHAQNDQLRHHLDESESARSKLQEQITMLTSEVEALNQKLLLEPTLIVSAPPPTAPSPIKPAVATTTSAQLVSSSLEELLKLQRLLERANEDLEASHRKYRALEEKHVKDVSSLREQCTKLKRESDARVKATSSSSKSNALEYAQALAKSRGASADERTQELEQQLRKIEYRFRSKTAEMDALVRSISRAGNFSDSSFVFGADSADDDASSMQSNTADISSMPPLLRNQLMEARLQAAESEVQSLQTLLGKERKEGLQKAKIQKLSAGGASSAKEKEKDAPLSPARSRTPSRSKEPPKPSSPARSPRRSAELRRGELAIAERERAFNDEIVSLRLQVADSRTQIQSLREEVARKTKLVISLKAARQAESTAADHWRLEAQGNEENLKRAHRAVGTKDAIIKDLRAKLEAQVEEAGKEAPSAATLANPIDAGVGAQPNDLKGRLKAAELERSRIRARLNVMRDRLGEAEAEAKELKEENAKLAKAGEKCESLRVALARKEAQLRSAKAQLETVQAESQEALQESDKRVKQLLRQLEILDRSYKELQDSLASLKARPPLPSFPTGVRTDGDSGSGSAPSRFQATSSQESLLSVSVAAQPAQQPSQTVSRSQQPAPPVPVSLGASTSDDLAYVMASLGLEKR